MTTCLIPAWFWAATLGVLGLMVGSFLNVVIYRLPAGLSVVGRNSPSACPGCGHRIRAWENIPLLSWLALRGRCSGCKNPISARYPIVEATTALLFAGVGLRFASDPWAIPAFLLVAALAVALSGIDIDTYTLPDKLVAAAYLGGIPLLVLATVLGASDTSALVRAAVGLVGSALFHFVAWCVYPRGMGWGDVKLSGALGMYLAWLGWGPLVVGVFGSYVIGLMVALPVLVRRRSSVAEPVRGALVGSDGEHDADLDAAIADRGIPFGPSMFAGLVVAVAVGEALWAGYLRAVGLV